MRRQWIGHQIFEEDNYYPTTPERLDLLRERRACEIETMPKPRYVSVDRGKNELSEDIRRGHHIRAEGEKRKYTHSVYVHRERSW